MKKNFILLLITITILNLQSVSAKDTSQSSIIMDLNTGRILYEKNANQKVLIASTTKIMTAIITIENTNINEYVTVGEEVLSMYGTNIYIEVGEKIKIIDLLYGLLLRSGNDAAVVLAKYVGSTEEKCVKMMNMKAKELGMNNTYVENPHGLDDDTKNYSTAYDMALLSKYVYSNKTYNKISKTKKYKTTTANKSYLWYNRNKMLTTYEFCTGGKNGYTPYAGKTLVTTATEKNKNFTIVTLNDPNIYETQKYLYDYAFSTYNNQKIIDRNNIKSILKKFSQNVYIKEDFIFPLKEEEISQIKTELILYDQKELLGQKGFIRIKLNDKIIGKVIIYEAEQKKEDSNIFLKLKNYLLESLKKLMLGLQNSLKPYRSVPIPLETNKSVLDNL